MPRSLILFIISEVDGIWNVHRHDGESESIAVGLPNEQQAIDITLPLAKANMPSRVVQINKYGHQKEIASFAESG